MSEDRTRSDLCGGIVRFFSPSRRAKPYQTLILAPIDFQNTQGIIFVIDSNDRERVSEAREELQRMLNEDELRDALLLVFANKQDLPNARTSDLLLVALHAKLCLALLLLENAAEITDKLGLHSLRQRTWYIQATCATSGDGLYEGLEWVSSGSCACSLAHQVLFAAFYQPQKAGQLGCRIMAQVRVTRFTHLHVSAAMCLLRVAAKS